MVRPAAVGGGAGAVRGRVRPPDVGFEVCRGGSSATTQLVALGIYPGAEVRLVQRFPAFVLQVELAEVALDERMAERVWVTGRDRGTG